MPKNYRKREQERQRRLRTQAAPAAGKRWWRKRRRITDGLIGLGSAAILAVYSIGYLNTQRAEGTSFGEVVAQTPAPTAAANHGPLVLVGTPTPAALAAGYKDGTFVGRGTSRHGGIEATLVIQGGKITSAEVSACGTRYSCRYVEPLVQEVIKSQAAPVDHVSGATDSSKAYRAAVESALQQASQS
jgi:uncharacterized protein with FMN-binding domain